jgi:hypothetical protein
MDRPTKDRPRIWDGRIGCMGDAIVGQTLLGKSHNAVTPQEIMKYVRYVVVVLI